jgi:predicted ATPase
MPGLKKITITGFRSIQHMEICLKQINLLIGPNGSGKSNIISVFDLLHSIVDKELQNFIAKNGGANSQFHYGTKYTPYVSVKTEFGDNAYSFQLSPDNNDQCYFSDETVSRIRKSHHPYVEQLGSGHRESKLSEFSDNRKDINPVAEFVQSVLSNWLVYHFHDTGDNSPLKRMNSIDDTLYLYPDGGNLTAYLYYLKDTAPLHYSRIIAAIHRIFPPFKKFIFQVTDGTIRMRWTDDKIKTYNFPISAFSDGTLRFIALATLLLQPRPPQLILLDEPELGLHPYAITILAELLKIASNEAQIIISTQSVQLLNEFGADSIFVVEQENGATKIDVLSEDKLENWLEDYAMGDLWQMNLIGGNP